MKFANVKIIIYSGKKKILVMNLFNINLINLY